MILKKIINNINKKMRNKITEYDSKNGEIGLLDGAQVIDTVLDIIKSQS